MSDIRIGNGFDVHKLQDGAEVILCGIKIAHNKKLIGHSDADVGLHSLTDAILGALGKGDLGRWFPPSDPTWENINSKIFLDKALCFMREKAFTILNIDLTFICEEPKISLYSKDMVNNVAQLCNMSAERINIKATTSEGLGFAGRKEGIAVLTSVLLIKT